MENSMTYPGFYDAFCHHEKLFIPTLATKFTLRLEHVEGPTLTLRFNQR